MDKKILTEKEAALYIGMSRSFLSRDRTNKQQEGGTIGPIFIKVGRSVRYHKHDLDLWLNQHRISRSI